MITGEQVKATRLLRGLSQMELAHLAGVAQQSIADIEADKPDISDKLRLKVREALEAVGVEFAEGEWPRLKTEAVKRTTGPARRVEGTISAYFKKISLRRAKSETPNRQRKGRVAARGQFPALPYPPTLRRSEGR